MSKTFEVVQAMSGHKNVIVIPRPYLNFFRGEQQAHALAAVLNNLVFWSAFGNEKGWFYKTYEELGEDAGGLSKDQTERLVKKLVKNHLAAAIQTSVRKVNGTPTMHYKVDGDTLISLIFNEDSEIAKSRNQNREVTTSKTRSRDMQSAKSQDHGNREVAESFLYTDVNTDIDIQTNKPLSPVSSKPDDSSVLNPDAAVSSPSKRQWGSAEDLRCAKWIWSRIVSMYEKAAEADGEVSKPKEPNWADWANEVRLMCSRDGRTHRQICELFGRVQRDPFWCRNVLSPSKLREKWDDLSIKLSPAGGQRSITDIPSADYEIPDGFRG